MKVESSDNGFNYIISELSLDQDSYYRININKEGYVFTIPEIYVPIPYEPIPVSSYINLTGRMNEFVISFNYTISNLTPSDLTLTPNAIITSVTSSSDGLYCRVRGEFERNTTYTLKITKFGYDFGADKTFTTYPSWERKSWIDVFTSIGLVYDSYDYYPQFCNTFLKEYFFVAIGGEDSMPKDYIWTKDFITWKKLPKPANLNYRNDKNNRNFNCWCMYNRYLYIFCPRSDIEMGNGGWVYKTDLSQPTITWELIVDNSDWYWDDGSKYYWCTPTCIGVTSATIWVNGNSNDIDIHYDCIRITPSTGAVTWVNNGADHDEITIHVPLIHCTAGSSRRLLLTTLNSYIVDTTSYGWIANIDVDRWIELITGNWTPNTLGKQKDSLVIDSGQNRYVSYQSYYDNKKWYRHSSDDAITITDIPEPFYITDDNRIISQPSNGSGMSTNTMYITYLNHNDKPAELRNNTIYTFYPYTQGWNVWENQIFPNPEENPISMGAIVGLDDGYCIMHYLAGSLGSIEYPWFYMSPIDYWFGYNTYNMIINYGKRMEGKWD